MRKNDAFVAKIVITRLTKGFMAMFAPAESLPSPATLESLSDANGKQFVGRRLKLLEADDKYFFESF